MRYEQASGGSVLEAVLVGLSILGSRRPGWAAAITSEALFSS